MKEKKNINFVIIVIVIIILIVYVLFYGYSLSSIFNTRLEDNYNVLENYNFKNNITKEELQEKIFFTFDYFTSWSVYCGNVDEKPININGLDRYISKEYKTYDEMLEKLKSNMSIDIIVSKDKPATNREYYLEKDNNLYCETLKSFMVNRIIKNIKIIKEENNKINFESIIKISDPKGNKYDYKVIGIIEYIDNNWIITSFEIQNN